MSTPVHSLVIGSTRGLARVVTHLLHEAGQPQIFASRCWRRSMCWKASAADLYEAKQLRLRFDAIALQHRGFLGSRIGGRFLMRHRQLL